MLSLENYNKLLNFKSTSVFMNNNDGNSFGYNKRNVENFIRFLNFSQQLDKIDDIVNGEESIEEIVQNYIKTITDKTPMPMLIDKAHHVSQVAKCMSENVKNKKMSDITLLQIFKDFSQRHVVNEEFACSDGEELLAFLQKQNYPIFFGHFLERCLRDIIFDGQTDMETMMNNGLSSTLNELKKHNSDDNLMNAFKSFSKDVKNKTLFFQSYFTNFLQPCCTILKERFPAKEYNDKINFSHFGLYGEGDYMFDDILVDCKCYQTVTYEKLQMFLFQLLGYYINNKYLRVFDNTRPVIKKFLIIDPIEDHCQTFSYYCVDIEEYKEDLDTLCTFYLDFCKVCFS